MWLQLCQYNIPADDFRSLWSGANHENNICWDTLVSSDFLFFTWRIFQSFSLNHTACKSLVPLFSITPISTAFTTFNRTDPVAIRSAPTIYYSSDHPNKTAMTRKQPFPHRSLTKDDLRPGRFFTISFAITNSSTVNEQSQSTFASCPTPSSFSIFPTDNTLPCIKSNHVQTDRDRNDIDRNPLTIPNHVAGTQHSITKTTSFNLPAPFHFGPRKSKSYSLANLYLDTRFVNGRWRKDCLRIIRSFERKRRRALARHKAISTKQLYRNSSNQTDMPSKARSKSQNKSKRAKIHSRELPCPFVSSPPLQIWHPIYFVIPSAVILCPPRPGRSTIPPCRYHELVSHAESPLQSAGVV